MTFHLVAAAPSCHYSQHSLPIALRAIEELTQQKHSLVLQVEELRAKLHHLHPSLLQEQEAEAKVDHAHYHSVDKKCSSTGTYSSSSRNSLSPEVSLVVQVLAPPMVS